MKLRTHAFSIAAMTVSCAVSGMVLADGVKSQWKNRQPISNDETEVKTDMTTYSAFELQKRTEALNASFLPKLLVEESARLMVRKGKQIAETKEGVETPKATESFGEVDRVRSVKKLAKPVACANLHTHERAECLSREAYRKTTQYKANVAFKTALNTAQ